MQADRKDTAYPRCIEKNTREAETKTVKIDAKAKEDIKAILFSRIDSQKLPDSSQERIYRELLPLLPGNVTFDHFQSALFRFLEKRQENPRNAFNLFIEFLELSIVGKVYEKKNIDKRMQSNKKREALSAGGERNTKRSRKHQGLDKSRTDESRQELKQTQMRLADRDRLMATARHPDYIEDWKGLISEIRRRTNDRRIRTLNETLCQKWELKYWIPPHLGKESEDWEILLKTYQREAILELSENEWPNRLFEIYQNASGKCVFVRLRIDLTRGKKELSKAFNDKIRLWTKNISKDRKPRKTKYDPWKIYDMAHDDKDMVYDDKLNLLKIARKLYGKDTPRGKRTPTYNPELWSPYKRVKRAYDQAVEMIEAVKPLHSFPINHLVDV